MATKINGFFPGELEPHTTVGGCIDIFENAWPNTHQTIDMVEKQAADTDTGVFWERAGTIGSGAHQTARTNDMMGISYLAEIANNPVLQNVHNQFNMLLLAATSGYAARYDIHEGFWHEGYSLLRYQGGQQYKAHYDGGTEIGRCISCLVYLNDNYVGGEIEFPNFNVKIKPEPGMLIIFPSNFAYRHIAHPVTEGVKYNLVTWIKDRNI